MPDLAGQNNICSILKEVVTMSSRLTSLVKTTDKAKHKEKKCQNVKLQ